MKIYNINNPIVQEIFLKEQQERGLKHGDVDPYWLDDLEETISKGISIPELKKRVKEYYDIVEFSK